MASGPGDNDEAAGRLALSGLFGFVLLVPPLITLFSRGGPVLGVSRLWLYLLVSWSVVILLVALFSRRAE
ncbi:hypothetical protein [Lentzea jiangxiensis]|uniref:Uncharacterized protein n=1 Tax=Lentzea jiangxiensis TaxID=641025 RepID=A0A1H0X7B3_9PSEU|nr:hypothetical protein [Lentzea jiangxiensis]SDP98838.1 hypothetical protein SAMN05421507_14410 [Lentzea jiangxiensis]